MEIDSTCGYADKEGFRCGRGDEFSVFNILSREKLSLKERSLVVMDSSLFNYNNYTYQEGIDIMNKLQSRNDSFTMLWHNSYIKHIDFLENYLKISKVI